MLLFNIFFVLHDKISSMKRNIFYASLAVVAMMYSCSRTVYNNESYIDVNNLEGKKVAILPVEIQFTGRLPKGMGVEQKRLIEGKESLDIQNILYNEYLYRSRGRKKQHSVDLINPEMINARLREKSIEVRESWLIPSDSLAKILGADLVIRARVKKDRIMSDAASLGVGVATTVLGSILSKDGSGAAVGTGGKTYQISFDATLTDATSGTVVSKISKEGSASWSHSPESVIRSSGRKLVRRGAVSAAN